MACCAIAAFILCNILLFAQRLRARLAGVPAAPPVRNTAATWTPASSPGIRPTAPKRGRWHRLALMALGLGFAATTIATMAGHPAPHAAPAAVAQILERVDATLCSSISSLTRTDTHGDVLWQEP